MKFSQRIGVRPLPTSGLEEATEPLRIALWNYLHTSVLPNKTNNSDRATPRARLIWNHLGWRTDEIPNSVWDQREQLSKFWFKCNWPDFFDLVEFIARTLANWQVTNPYYDQLNMILESQGCAYRFIAGELAPLTNPMEVSEVRSAAESAIPAVATHIREALQFLPPGADVSPRNSVKESISAVESALKNLSEDASATFKQGLMAFENKYGALHPAFREGLLKLYGYTSDEKGVRHALMDETADVTIDDARFMLVICSAFANYLVKLSS